MKDSLHGAMYIGERMHYFGYFLCTWYAHVATSDACVVSTAENKQLLGMVALSSANLSSLLPHPTIMWFLAANSSHNALPNPLVTPVISTTSLPASPEATVRALRCAATTRSR